MGRGTPHPYTLPLDAFDVCFLAFSGLGTAVGTVCVCLYDSVCIPATPFQPIHLT